MYVHVSLTVDVFYSVISESVEYLTTLKTIVYSRISILGNYTFLNECSFT